MDGGFNENKLDLVYLDGQSFFVPTSAAETKINGIRKWEQAFRVYGAIYSQANPARVAEIWQYVHIINTAVSAYVCDNVSNYDITFRHLMSTYLQRSWAKIYNQMWNLSMQDSLPKNNQYASGGTKSSEASQLGNSSWGMNSQPRQRLNYCWVFNKGSTCKDGSKCKFVN